MSKRSNTMVQLKFVAKSLNELCCNEYGSPIFVEIADKVFEDILGARRLVSKLYMVDNLQKAVSIVNEVGFDTLIKIFDQNAYRDAVEDMINTRGRIDQLRKESKKLYRRINSNDEKRRHREQDLVAYKQKTKEIRYATEIYESAIKRLRKYLGIKNPKKKGINKERYAFLKNFAKRTDDGFFNRGFMDDDALGDYAFDGFESLYSMANDAGHSYVNSMKTRLKSEDDDSDQEGNFSKFLEDEELKTRKMNRFSDYDAYPKRRKITEIPDFISSAEEMRNLDIDYNNEDEDEDDYDDDESNSRDISRDFRMDREIDARLTELNEKYEMLGRTISKVIPSTKDTFENQREKDESREEVMEQIVQALEKVAERVSRAEDKFSKIDQNYSEVKNWAMRASEEYQNAKESYDAIREYLMEDVDDEDTDSIDHELEISEDQNVTDLEVLSMNNNSDYVPSHPRAISKDDTEEVFEAEKYGTHNPKDSLRKLTDPEWLTSKQDVALIRDSVDQNSKDTSSNSSTNDSELCDTSLSEEITN